MLVRCLLVTANCLCLPSVPPVGVSRRCLPSVPPVGVSRRCLPSVSPVSASRRCLPSASLVGVSRRCLPSVSPVGVSRRCLSSLSPVGVSRRCNMMLCNEGCYNSSSCIQFLSCYSMVRSMAGLVRHNYIIYSETVTLMVETFTECLCLPVYV